LHPLVAPLERPRTGYLGCQQLDDRPFHRIRFPGYRLTPLNALSFLLAIVFFFIEALALIMALTHTYESLDATCRICWNRRIDRLEPQPNYLPIVSLHVPAYNEPPELVAETLKSLAALDYPDYEVLVIDNNTRIARPGASWKTPAASLGQGFISCTWTNGRVTNPAPSISP